MFFHSSFICIPFNQRHRHAFISCFLIMRYYVCDCQAFAPFTPIAQCCAIFLVGEIADKAVVVTDDATGEKTIAIRRMLPLCATLDHRIIDGVLGGRICKDVHALVEEFVEEMK
jgi:pyruvate/2-oxoglutarate dehydrogenase complex dihydrolipoamide acyltransferase (E2) component